jgi:hypothetical protein
VRRAPFDLGACNNPAGKRPIPPRQNPPGGARTLRDDFAVAATPVLLRLSAEGYLQERDGETPGQCVMRHAYALADDALEARQA